MKRKGVASAITCAGTIVAVVAVAVTVANLPGEARNAAAGAAPAPVPRQQMPEQIETVAREGLGPNADLGAGRVVWLDRNWGELPEAAADRAEAMYVTFGQEGKHNWKVFLGEATDRPADPCAASEAHLCQAADEGDGAQTVVTVTALVEAPPERFGPGKFMVADLDEVTPADLPELRLERNVRTIRADGSMTSVTEQVNGPISTEPKEVFDSSTTDLMRLAADPSLVLADADA